MQATVLAAPVTTEIEDRRSVFRAHVVPCASEEEARAAIDAVRAVDRMAGHHCTGFLIGLGREVRRSNDDGEPSGTAGAPILTALEAARVGEDGAQNLTNVVAVVSRWFGGVLLGAGGLVRAYGGAVTAALDEATFLTRRSMRIRTLEIPHADAGRLEHDLRSRGLTLQATEYGARLATLRIAVPDADAEVASLDALVAQLTSGRETGDAGITLVDESVRR